MHATATWISGDQLELSVRGKTYITDQQSGEVADPSPADFFLASYAGCIGFYAAKILRRKGFEPEGLRVLVKGHFSENPHRLGALEASVTLPSGLSPELREMAQRAAESCLIHHTLQHPPQITFSYDSL